MELLSAKHPKKPLMLQYKKPVAIASHVPRFNERSYRHQDPDKARAELTKLKRLTKREHRGALRELRKDNQFLANVTATKQREKDQVYAQKMKRIEGFLANEQGEMKLEQKIKQRKKK